MKRIGGMPDARLLASAITLGEIEAGQKMTAPGCTNPTRRDEYLAWVGKQVYSARPKSFQTPRECTTPTSFAESGQKIRQGASELKPSVTLSLKWEWT